MKIIYVIIERVHIVQNMTMAPQTKKKKGAGNAIKTLHAKKGRVQKTAMGNDLTALQQI